MFNGAHVVINSQDAEADRRFFRDILRFPNVDVGGGWLIFALPEAEAAVHPHDSSVEHALYLMCDDIAAMRQELANHGVASTEVSDEGWGLLSAFTLPGGSTVGFYQPRHAKPSRI